MRLSDLLKLSGLDFSGKIYKNTEITSIENDARKIKGTDNKNILFICICGCNYDSHSEIEKLAARGVKNFVILNGKCVSRKNTGINLLQVNDTRRACAILARAFYGFPDKKLKIIGITGTKGKTTTTYILKSIFDTANKACGVIGTCGIAYRDIRKETKNSTPDSIIFYKTLYEMLKSGVEYVFCEVTSQAMKQDRVYGIIFDLAIFTNLYPDHISKNEHASFEEYKAFKGKLFSVCRQALINIDSEHSGYFIDICKRNSVPVSTFSLKNDKADIFANCINVQSQHSSFEALGESYHTGLIGEYNITNSLCAISVARLFGIDDISIKKGVENAKVFGRCENVNTPNGVSVVIDYAHNKESLENILEALKKICKGKLYCVFGAGGDRSRVRRSSMGEIATKYCDLSFITSDNPRSEKLEDIISDIVENITDKNKYIIIPDRKEAIFAALSRAKSGDTVLLAGKGEQLYEEVNGIKYDFDERLVVREFYEGNCNYPF